MLCDILELGCQSVEHVGQNQCIGIGNNIYQALVKHIEGFANLISIDDEGIHSERIICYYFINFIT